MTVIQKNFNRLKSGVGLFKLRGSTLLIPEMNPMTSPLLAAVFESHSVPTRVLETYVGLDLGKAYTSGKECFPCQVTLGDVLQFLHQEKSRLGARFDPVKYVIFMPGADGPCRFGMYNKFQRIVLDSFPEYKDIRIASMSSEDSYMVGEIIDKSRARDFRKMGYTALIVGDLLERLLWRVRPYERIEGSAKEYVKQAQQEMVELFRKHAKGLEFKPIYDKLQTVFEEALELIDTAMPQKPLIGIVGEIYLRTHVEANQHVIESLEEYGAEVVNATIGEWVNYTSYEKLAKARNDLTFSLRSLNLKRFRSFLKLWLGYAGDSMYQRFRHKSLYKLACNLLPIHGDHEISHLDTKLKQLGIFDFEIPGEACLSISGALTYKDHGFNGVVNVYPFTCMPSTITSSILKPWFHREKFPYMDAAYDGSYQTGREAAIRTFMYQAHQHLERNNGHAAH